MFVQKPKIIHSQHLFLKKWITEQILDEMNFGTDEWNLKGFLSVVTLQMDAQVFLSIRHVGR